MCFNEVFSESWRPRCFRVLRGSRIMDSRSVSDLVCMVVEIYELIAGNTRNSAQGDCWRLVNQSWSPPQSRLSNQHLFSSFLVFHSQRCLFLRKSYPTSAMTRPTKSRVLAILVLGAAISSSVLAAPASIPPPLSRPSTNSFSTEAQPLHSRSVGQTAEVAMLRGRRVEHVNLVSRQDGSDLTTINDPEYGLGAGKDATGDMNSVAVSVNLKQRADRSPAAGSSTETGGAGSGEELTPESVMKKIQDEIDKMKEKDPEGMKQWLDKPVGGFD
ncbi:hypothetical protein FB446DRAFT_759838 [Lentinula raphanica]|nr:hypothetical protein FB446DRAFT_759838 [Lentinula raphanica]